MLRIFSVLLLMLSMSVTHAADLALMGALGARGTSGTTDISSNASVSNKLSLSGGILGAVPVRGQLAFRSGFLVTQRYAEISPTNQGTVDVNFVYVDIPVTLMYLFTPTAGAFAGPVIAMNVVKDCAASAGSGSVCTNVKSVIFPLTVGVQAKFFDQFGAEAFYEYTPGDIADHISNYTSVGVNLLFYFD